MAYPGVLAMGAISCKTCSMKYVVAFISLCAGLLGVTGTSMAAEGKIAPLVQPYIDRHVLAGAVMCVGKPNRIIDLEAAGFANVETRDPIKVDSLFWIASQTKAMTAAAVMMLVDEGKLRLDDPVEKYIPEFTNLMVGASSTNAAHKPSHPITLREVLSHTAGLPFRSKAEQPTIDMLPLVEAVHSYTLEPLQSDPGTKYSYSNEGINIAGRIIEIVSGISYEQFMQQRLFTPLKMRDTTFRPTSEQISRLATSYKANAAKDGLAPTHINQLHYPLDDSKRQPVPAGGLFSTATDVMHFCQMLANDGKFGRKRYLSSAAVAELCTKQTGPLVKDSYGLGLAVGPDWYGHGGAYSTNMKVDKAHNLLAVWLVQIDTYPADGSKAAQIFETSAVKFYGTH